MTQDFHFSFLPDRRVEIDNTTKYRGKYDLRKDLIHDWVYSCSKYYDNLNMEEKTSFLSLLEGDFDSFKMGINMASDILNKHMASIPDRPQYKEIIEELNECIDYMYRSIHDEVKWQKETNFAFSLVDQIREIFSDVFRYCNGVENKILYRGSTRPSNYRDWDKLEMILPVTDQNVIDLIVGSDYNYYSHDTGLLLSARIEFRVSTITMFALKSHKMKDMVGCNSFYALERNGWCIGFYPNVSKLSGDTIKLLGGLGFKLHISLPQEI
jgi:hypothetical protein